MKFSAVSAVVAALIVAGSAQANIVINGDFENQLVDWTQSGWGLNISGTISGAYSASTGCVGDACIHDRTTGAIYSTSGTIAGGAYLFQDLVTVPGTTYSLDFDFGGQGFTNELAIVFGTTTIFDGVNLPTENLHYSVTGLVATDAVTRLTFFGRQDPSYNRLDNVVVQEATAAIPEPASWAMMAGGFGLLGTMLRRRRVAVSFA